MKILGHRTRHVFARALSLWVQHQLKTHGACDHVNCSVVIRALSERLDGDYTEDEFLVMWEIFKQFGHHPDDHYAENIPKEHLL